MKREEAIELLEDLDGAIEDNHGRDYDEAFRMAIEALSKDELNINETNAPIIADALRYYAHNEELPYIERVKAVVLMEEFLHCSSQMRCGDEEKMNELIRRKDAINVVCKDWCSNKTSDDVCGRCEDVQSMLAIPPAKIGWIPCSERLPKKVEGMYWVCTSTGHQYECGWTNKNLIMNIENTSWHWSISDISPFTKVVAWMPRPESYREGGE